ncbi:hypothetical protein KFK09_021600 [Dendrobium nobile]|uniref:Uncharacterized protein n=1 Tax=Dendrobium nobile TaxID=94219 RepID=A0A8T3APQ9_DENNO|nr:hypothetical protein KFK09_021600 [Dendrobium nobile]
MLPCSKPFLRFPVQNSCAYIMHADLMLPKFFMQELDIQPSWPMTLGSPTLRPLSFKPAAKTTSRTAQTQLDSGETALFCLDHLRQSLQAPESASHAHFLWINRLRLPLPLPQSVRDLLRSADFLTQAKPRLLVT